MANEYVTLATLKDSLGIETADTTRDSLLNDAASAASRSIDLTCGRRFWIDPSPVERVLKRRGRVLDTDDGQQLLIDDIGDGTVTIETGPRGGPWTDVTADVELEPTEALDKGEPVTSLLYVGKSWPAGVGQRVRVTARWGWPAVPADIAEAAKLQAMRLYRRKDSPEGVTGSAEWGVVRLSRRDPDVWALIEHFMAPGFG